MPVNLCFTIRFLQPYSHGRGNDGNTEWPPSPLRLFQALVSASAGRWNERTRLHYAASALAWLEQQDAPTIVATAGVRSEAGYRLYVPDNVADKVARSWLARKEASIAEYRIEKDVQPTRLLGDAAHYLYSISATDSAIEIHCNTLTEAARSITHLGWGVDMVVGNASILTDENAAQLQGERWSPTLTASATRFRIPVKGTLAELSAKHNAQMNRLTTEGPNPVAPLTIFRIASYQQANAPPVRRHVAFRLRHPVEDRSAVFSMTRANAVAAMTRHLTGLLAQEQGRDREWIDRYVHGHRAKSDESQPRFSYLPLPSLERRGERRIVLGSIRRVLLAELIDSEQSQLPWTRQMLPGQFLTDDHTHERKALLIPLTEIDWVLKQYTDPSETWATATPLVLPGSDEGKFAKAEKLFFKSLRHSGYSPEALAELELRNVSFWQGGELALRFRRPDYLRNGHWSVYHVWLRWKQATNGPLAIGAGRHCGLGVFARMSS